MPQPLDAKHAHLEMIQGVVNRWLDWLFGPSSAKSTAQARQEDAQPPKPAPPNWPAPRTGSIVLFLDFDGVLHPGQAGTFRYLPVLEDILDQVPELDIVLSTSWRETDTMTSLLSNFRSAYRERVRGVTPVMPSMPLRRYHEIMAYVAEHGLTRYLAVDDEAALFPDGCDWLFLVNRLDALYPENGQVLLARIGALRDSNPRGV